ncbi:hypothetical protein PIB30_071024 [Stylosanthes scabra]|uniref:Uncharacterized protein n=1 Tax=Stylosanthes scabra TaxID=79078 RepID=A0ABU6ZMB8_9FABA|nr:hypothetical protein [Stylosanthes scabra]
MAANRCNAQRVSVDSDPPADTATFMAAMNSMAIAMRDSTAAIRESATATNRAMEYMGRRNRKNGNGGDDEEMDNGFEDLCRFSRMGQGNLAEFEEWKCIKYEGGLREELLTSVGPMEIRNFAELVNKSQLAED